MHKIFNILKSVGVHVYSKHKKIHCKRNDILLLKKNNTLKSAVIIIKYAFFLQKEKKEKKNWEITKRAVRRGIALLPRMATGGD